MKKQARAPRTLRRLQRLVAACAVILLSSSVVAGPVSAASTTIVSLAFDNGTISQYTLAYQQALQPHNAHATFFVNSGTVGASGNFMSWAQLTTLSSAGNDIGGKTVNATNLTTDPNPSAQVCNDRAALIQHGFTPIAFAYPGGTQNASVQSVVSACGYGNGRTAGGLSATGATYAETNPPANWFATRAYAPSAVTLANMQSLVTGASTHGGGWDQIVIGKICSQTLDPNNYSACSTSSGHIELADLNTFLDWIAAAGQSGGAPAGVTLDTVGHVASTSDPGAPTTTISCNGAACGNSPYPGIVSVTLAATDVGSGVSSTHYTTDGSDPTLSSPTYSGAFNVNGSNSSTTVKYRSWDYAGNVESTRTQVVQAPPDTAAPSTTISCNGAGCSASPYVGSVSVTLAATDTGGSGVDKTYYTTDGSPVTSASSVYTGAFQLNVGTYTVRFFSTDKAGNAEAPNSQLIQVVSPTTAVTLAFDDGSISNYTLGYQQALQLHNVPASFFVNSGIVGSTPKFMSWAQLAEMQAAGNDIGSKTVHGTNLTTADAQTAASEVCGDAAALRAHGLDPVAFAYPFGAISTGAKAAVAGCGFGNGRSAGSVSPNGPTYAETIPPKDWFATRAYAPSGQLSLANMQALVSGAATRGGGWDQIVIQKVCSQAQDPTNYSTCTASASWIELSDLNAFLDWMANAGQSGGAPAGAVLATARTVLVGADTMPPTTTISCDGAACPTGPVSQVVHASFAATDVGSSVASTHYTTDGTDPTLSSPAFGKPVPVTSPTTVKFRSWDFAGNAEPVETQFIQATPPPDNTPPTTTISCNGTACGTTTFTNSVSISLSADDGTGWGVANTYYTTDGSQPTTSSTAYTGPFQLGPGTYTVQFFSTDLANNAEQVQSQQIQVLPPQVVVSLTFDDGIGSQYALGFKQALKPHNMRGTFYIITGHPEVDPEAMTWAQIRDLNNGGNEIGGHTVNHVNLKTTTDHQTIVNEVCGSRQDLLQHGFYPTSFAYPEGAYNAEDESVVQSCGFTSGRAAGGIDVAGDGAGPVFSETIPPKDPFATRTTYDPPSGSPPNVPPLSLAHMQAAVNSAAQHGGGWIQFVFHQVCSQTFDQANYQSCMQDWGPVDLPTLNQLLDWLQSAGQPGGAPPRTTVETVSQVIDGPDTSPPVTSLLCNGAPCQSSAYSGSLDLNLSATDPGGSGVAATYFTTDGSTPTTSSPTFAGQFIVTQNTTLKFFSVDNAGNTEAIQTFQVLDQPNADPVVGAAGDIACDPTAPAYNGGDGTAQDCRAKSVANLLTGSDAVLPIGDDQYECGGYNAFLQSYDQAWGRFKSITNPVPGDKDYATAGGTDCPSTPGAGYYQYFGSRAGDPTKGYYSYNLGSWHVIAINTGPCSTDPTFCAAGSAEDQWLQSDLAANASAPCTLAYYQNPRFASTPGGGDTTYQAFWQDLYTGGADVVLNGDSHWYERFAPMDASGAADPTYGVREFIVGTGGAALDTASTPLPTSEVLNDVTHGVIKLTLHAGSFDWRFVNDADGTFTDSGTSNCHPAPDHTPPTTTISCNGAACAGTYTAPVQVTLTATDNVFGRGVDKTYYTTDGSTPTTASAVYTGPFSVLNTSTVNYFSTDLAGNQEAPKSQTILFGNAQTTIACNGAACSSGWYKTPVQVTFSATDVGGPGVGSTYYTTDGSAPTTSSTVYAGPFTVSAPTTVRFFSTDAFGSAEVPKSQLVQVDSTPPTTSAACNGAACSGWYPANVSVTLPAIDNAGGSGVSRTYYTTNGTTPTTSSTVYTSAFTISATSTVKFFSTDVAGNSEAVKSQLIQIDKTVPTTTITCNAAACSSGWYKTNVTVALSATDAGGSGLNKTYYTTNGSTPTTSSTVYSGPFAVSATTTVKFFSTDNAGGSEAVKTQLIQIDGTAPTTTIACNGAACSSGWYAANVSVTLPATDNAGGSGVSRTYYTTDGTTPTTSSTVYSRAFSLSGTATVRFFSTDVAGNSEAVKSQLIQIDKTAPTTTITCNGTACSTGWYRASVQVALPASDGTGGSGASKTYYTTNGSTPTTSSTVYSSPFTVSSTSTVKFFSVDVAGNAEAVKSQLIRIDGAAPTVTMTQPAQGASYNRGSSINLAAVASDLGTGSGAPSGVSSVTFFVDGQNLATDTSSPYTATWGGFSTLFASRGPHTFVAVATDAAGNSTTSAPITITLN